MMLALAIVAYLAVGVATVFAGGVVGLFDKNHYSNSWKLSDGDGIFASLCLVIWPLIWVCAAIFGTAFSVRWTADQIGGKGLKKRQQIMDNRARIRRERQLAAGEMQAAEKKVEEVLTGTIHNWWDSGDR